MACEAQPLRAFTTIENEALFEEYEAMEASGVADGLGVEAFRELIDLAVARAAQTAAARNAPRATVDTPVVVTATTVTDGELEGHVLEAEVVATLPPVPPPPYQDPASHGRVQLPPFEKLTVNGLLGCGGFGYVELVTCTQMPHSSTYARKCISKGFVVKCGMTQSLKMERLILALARSPFVVSFYGSYNRAEHIYFMVEPALGGELYSLYLRRKVLHGSEPHARYYIASVFLALQHLHSINIVCRGVKPEDCVLDDKGRLKLCDMGLAKIIVTKTFTTCGTPDYFAPEVIASSGHSFPVDFWALGVFLYELLAGSSTFASAYPMQIYEKVMKGVNQVKFAKAAKPAEPLIKTLLSRSPDKRVPDPGSFKGHSWFQDLDWVRLAEGHMPGPYVPKVASPVDVSNFHANRADAPKDVAYVDNGSGWDRVFG